MNVREKICEYYLIAKEDMTQHSAKLCYVIMDVSPVSHIDTNAMYSLDDMVDKQVSCKQQLCFSNRDAGNGAFDLERFGGQDWPRTLFCGNARCGELVLTCTSWITKPLVCTMLQPRRVPVFRQTRMSSRVNLVKSHSWLTSEC